VVSPVWLCPGGGQLDGEGGSLVRAWCRWQQSGGGSAAAAAASLAAEAAAWQKRDFGGSGSTLGSTAAARRWRQKCGVGGVDGSSRAGCGSGGSAVGRTAVEQEGRDDVLSLARTRK
jgi:hypothetical protein